MINSSSNLNKIKNQRYYDLGTNFTYEDCTTRNDKVSEVTNYHFSQDTIESLRELGSVIIQIRKRLTTEGYTIADGKIVKLNSIK